MAKTKISEFSSTPGNNTDIDSINIAEGCPPSGINDAIRELMAQLKDWQSGTSNDPYVVGSSGSLTLSYGTANGVAYLNGSKVLTSGSALTFDGSNLETTGNTTLANNKAFQIKNTGGTAQQVLTLGNDNNVYMGQVSSPTAGALFTYGNQQIFYAGASEGMRLTSTGLGIGTSSPSVRLQTNATINTAYSASNTLAGGVVAYIKNASATNSTDATIRLEATGSTSVAVTSISAVHTGDGASALTFGTRTNAASDVTEKMRLDSAGNLGLGVTPSAWGALKALQIGYGSISGYSGATGAGIWLASNAYYNGTNWVYQSNSQANYYNQLSGVHAWFTAPSGTAGNAISFTQAMSLLASGDLAVGTTTAAFSSGTGVFVRNAAAAATYIGINHNSSSSSGNDYVAFGYNGSQIGGISQNGTTAVAYNTSSDYRLKNITGPITTSGAYIDSLNPVEGTWKADGSTFVGLIAHEAQEASRTQVATGVKDGEEMQAMDYSSSEIIANMIAELKSVRQRLAALESK